MCICDYLCSSFKPILSEQLTRTFAVLVKVVFKIHFKPFWVILDILFFWVKMALFLRFCPFWKFLQVFWTFKGWKNIFSQKCPNYGLLSEKNIKKFPLTFAEIGGGVKRKLTDVNFFFLFFLKASLIDSF